MTIATPISWLSVLVFTVPLALMLFPGCMVQVDAHALLLADGGGVALVLRPRYET
ncbi:MAG: hypothetical protein SFX73_02005 [Kofleriaceae bacterium]|nr:hypothetical protein [Kofleriaceae bacterium]